MHALVTGGAGFIGSHFAGTAMEPTFAPARAGEPWHSALDSAKAAHELNWLPGITAEADIRHTYQQLTIGLR